VAPAWSTSNTISFVEPDLGDLTTAEGLLAVKGLSLHEVSHILFTPRSGSDIVRWVMEHKLGSAFNMLEDQRIETLMVGRFGTPVVSWLTAVVAQHLLSSPRQLSTAFALLHGRKYLPIELRQIVRDSYIKQEDVEELSELISAYRTFLYPQDDVIARSVIARYSELMKGALKEAGQSESDTGGCGGKRADAHESTEDSRPLSKKAQNKAREKADAREEEEEEGKGQEEEFNFGDPDGDAGDAGDAEEEEPEEEPEGSGSDAGDVDDATEGDGDKEGESSGNTPDNAEGSPENSEGTSEGSSEYGGKTFSDLLNDILDDVKTELANDLDKDLANLRGDTGLEANQSATPATAHGTTGTIDLATARASKAFGLELERLQAQFDPAWERETSTGRINVGRYMRGCDLDEAFDRWTTGREDAVDIEAVILLDSSTSMQGERERRASNAMWGLKRALDRVGASCTVVTFESSGSEKVLYKADERATTTVKRVEPDGGTNPIGALKYATNVFAQSGRAMKMLFTITDGAWQAGYQEPISANELTKKLRRAGVLTALAHIGGSLTNMADAHEHEIVASVDNSNELFLLGRQLVKVATQRHLSN
jgi:Mg-chelatase subunit ChlD